MQIRDVAFKLRQEIKNTTSIKLPEHLKAEEISKGDVEVPDLVQNFFKFLIGGPDSRKWDLESRKRRVKSISEDVVFSTTSGIKTSKHLQLGLAIKSLTGSRDVVEILSRMGHCVSYSTVEELETELIFEAYKNSKETPFGMKTTPEFNTGIAWDKLDHFVETKNVKDTLHDPVRMAYQMRDVPMTNLTAMHSEKSDNCTDSLPTLQQQGIRQKQQFSQKNQGLAIAIDGTSDNKKSRKRRRAYEPTGLNIEPCHKKPKTVGTSFLPLNHPLRTNPEAQANISKSCGKYILWMEDVTTDTENSTPM